VQPAALNHRTHSADSRSTSAPTAPRRGTVDQLGFVETDRRFHKSVVEGLTANRGPVCADGGRNGSSSGRWVAAKSSQLFFVFGDGGGEGFDHCAQVRDLGREAGQGEGVGLSGAVFVDDGAQLCVSR